MFAPPYRWVTQVKFFSINNPFSGKDPQCRFFYVAKGGTEISLEPARSQVPLAQTNPYANGTHSAGGGGGGGGIVDALNPFNMFSYIFDKSSSLFLLSSFNLDSYLET